MIKKIYRLNENAVKKVLKLWKPFFSYGLVVNFIKNNLPYNRFAIIIWWKSVKNAVTRNIFRRLFYKLVSSYILKNWNIWKDMVFVIKKQTKLDKNDLWIIKNFEKDINFLLNKI